MFYAGIDAHTKSSTICVVDRKGRKVSSSTVLTNAEGFRVGLGKWARRGLTAAVESSGITRWVCELLKALKVRAVVVNPNRVRLIAESRKKADRVDAETLAELLRLGGLPEVHQASPQARRLRAELGVRRQLVRQRTAVANQVRGLVRAWGVNLPARFLGRADGWTQLAERDVPEYIRAMLPTMQRVYDQLTRAGSWQRQRPQPLETILEGIAGTRRAEDLSAKDKSGYSIYSAASVYRRKVPACANPGVLGRAVAIPKRPKSVGFTQMICADVKPLGRQGVGDGGRKRTRCVLAGPKRCAV